VEVADASGPSASCAATVTDFGKPPLLPGGVGSSHASTAAGGEEEVDLEGTLNSNASKEFSFGTTKPAQLPSASQLELTLESFSSSYTLEVAAPDSGAVHRADELDRPQPDELESDAVTEATCPAGKAATEGGLSPKFGPAGKAAEEALLTPKTPDSEAGDLFTFGTTNPLALPDPALLRQLASVQDAPLVPEAEPSAGTLALPSGRLSTSERRTPRWEPADHQHAPLPPVQEVPQPQTPPQAAAQPDQAMQICSQYSISSQNSDHARMAQQWQMQQAAQVLQQQAHHAQVAQQWQMHQAHEAQRQQTWHEEVQKQQSEAADVAERQGQIAKSHDVEEQNLAPSESYGPYFLGNNGEELEEVPKVQPEPSKKRLAAAGCIVILAVLAVGCVVLAVSL